MFGWALRTSAIVRWPLGDVALVGRMIFGFGCLFGSLAGCLNDSDD